jgi:hypothetical protein
MRLPFELIWESGGVHKRYRGFVTGDEFIRSTEAVVADLLFESLRYVIEDFGAIDGHGMNHASLEGVLVQSLGAMSWNDRIRVLVVTTDPTILSLADATKLPPFDASYRTSVFATLTDARAWLAGNLAPGS